MKDCNNCLGDDNEDCPYCLGTGFVPTEPIWIDFSERVPPENNIYLCWDVRACGGRAYDWNGRHFKTLFRRTPQTKNVSHWMFAPEPNDL